MPSTMVVTWVLMYTVTLLDRMTSTGESTMMVR